jgi:hypothetical protein
MIRKRQNCRTWKEDEEEEEETCTDSDLGNRELEGKWAYEQCLLLTLCIMEMLVCITRTLNYCVEN